MFLFTTVVKPTYYFLFPFDALSVSFVLSNGFGYVDNSEVLNFFIVTHSPPDWAFVLIVQIFSGS